MTDVKRIVITLHLISGLILLSSVLSGTAIYAAPINSGNVEAELIAEMGSIKPGEPIWVALKQKIRPGWHTYWRCP